MNHPNIVANKSNQLVLTHVPAAERNPFDLAVVAATRVSVAVVSREKSGGAPCGHGKAANKNLRKKQIERKHTSSFFFLFKCGSKEKDDEYAVKSFSGDSLLTYAHWALNIFSPTF